MPVDLLVKRMPDDLKAWIAEEAKRHRRSVNQEAIVLLEEVRAARTAPRRADKAQVVALLQDYRSLPILDHRAPEDIVGYDERGLLE